MSRLAADQRHTRPSAGLLTAAFAGQFAISLAIVLAASLGLAGNAPSVWIGLIDVTLVFTLLVTVLRLERSVRGAIELPSIRIAYAIATGLLSGTLVVLWLTAGRIDLNVLLPGLAWRSGVLLWAMPSIVTVIRANAGRTG